MRSDTAKKWMDYKPFKEDTNKGGFPKTFSANAELTAEDWIILGLIDSARGGNAAACKTLFDIRYGPAASGSGPELTEGEDSGWYAVKFDTAADGEEG